MKLFSIFIFLFISTSLFAEVKIVGKIKNANNLDTVKVDDNSVFLVVENMPEFPGGTKALLKFIQSNIKYPENALKYKIEGNVYVSFIIEKDGSVSELEVIRGIGGGCDEEAKRVVSILPIFTPGKQNGKFVRVYNNIPVKFKL